MRKEAKVGGETQDLRWTRAYLVLITLSFSKELLIAPIFVLKCWMFGLFAAPL